MSITLWTLEVIVDSESDDRGLLGMDESIPAGPLSLRTRVRIGADEVAPGRLREIVAWAEKLSPVADAVRKAVPDRTRLLSLSLILGEAHLTPWVNPVSPPRVMTERGA